MLCGYLTQDILPLEKTDKMLRDAQVVWAVVLTFYGIGRKHKQFCG